MSLILKWDYNAVPTVPEPMAPLLQVFPEMGYSMPRDWRRVRAIIERVMDEEVKDES